jgi:hypothetical protein
MRRIRRGVLAGLALFAAFWWWDTQRVKVEYFATMIDRFGVPEGYGVLSEDEFAKREESYRVESKAGKVRRVVWIHSSGRLLEPDGQFGFSSQEVIYTEDGAIQEIIQRDSKNQVLVRKVFSERKPLGDAWTMTVEFKMDHQSAPMAIKSVAVGLKREGDQQNATDITVNRLVYLGDGLLSECHYLNHWGESRADGNGVFGLKYEYSGGVKPKNVLNLGIDGVPAPDRSGVGGAEFVYNTRGERISARVMDSAGGRALDSNGFHLLLTERDEVGNVTAQTYHDKDDKPALSARGYHKASYRLDQSGNIREQRFFD